MGLWLRALPSTSSFPLLAPLQPMAPWAPHKHQGPDYTSILTPNLLPYVPA